MKQHKIGDYHSIFIGNAKYPRSFPSSNNNLTKRQITNSFALGIGLGDRHEARNARI